MDEPARQIGRRERKKREMRRRIRRAAAQLFREKGYEATTVDEITDLADIAKGTFFNYFPRKDLLLEELAVEILEDVEAELGPPERWIGSLRAQLLRLYTRLGERVHRDPKLFMVMIVENLRSLWMRSAEEEPGRELRELTRDLLRRAVEERELPTDTDVEVATRMIEAAYATSTIESLQAGWAVEAYRSDLAARMNIIFRGLGGEPARIEGSGEA